MFGIYKENQRLYLANWDYNACRIINELTVIVENNGGTVKPGKTALVSNRTLSGAIYDTKEQIEKIENNSKLDVERKNKVLKSFNEKLEKYLSINNDPIAVTGTDIIFVYENKYYYYSISDNPFFEFHYLKTPIKDNKYSQDAACENDKKDWLYDCLLGFNASDADIKEAANTIFNMLVTASDSVIIRNSVKKRVPNYYNNGYHYETIYNKERIANIDWID